MTIEIIRSATSRAHLRAIAASQFGDMVKAVVDLERGIMAVGGEMHADEESALLEDGSAQADLWGINLMIEDPDDDWIEFDSMINIRPSQANRSRAVDDPQRRARIRALVAALVPR